MAKNILDVGGFTIQGRIGSGARTTIYLATDDQDEKIVALKRITLERPADTRIFEQVETEFKMSQRIDHMYIRKCYKLKKIRRLFKVKEILLSMEFFEGKSLEDSPSLSLIDVLLVFRMVASGLEAMHKSGFVHCDIKPNNILIDNSGSIKIIDLGQSCKIGTTKQRIQGTPDYIAPEQVRRKPLDPRTDIFNLGATIYWALTGHNVPTLIPKKKADLGVVIKEDCPTPHELKKQIPLAISNLVMDCVKDNSAQRPKDMTVVIAKLDTVIHSILGDKIKIGKNGLANTSNN